MSETVVIIEQFEDFYKTKALDGVPPFVITKLVVECSFVFLFKIDLLSSFLKNLRKRRKLIKVYLFLMKATVQ